VTPQVSLSGEPSGMIAGLIDVQASAENVHGTDAMPEVDISKVIFPFAVLSKESRAEVSERPSLRQSSPPFSSRTSLHGYTAARSKM